MPDLNLNAAFPTEITLHQRSRLLEVAFDDGTRAQLSHELLRVYSPSAEVRGHGQEVLQTGKRGVGITAVQPIGNYAVKLVFDDGHDSGLYSWDYLHMLCQRHEQLWVEYLRRLEAAGASREADAALSSQPINRGCKH